MRIFQQYYFDLKERVLFKDTLPFVEAWLAGQGIAYERMAFMMSTCCDRELFQKLLAKYPGLETYRRIDTGGWEITQEGLMSKRGELKPFDYTFSSVPQYWPEPYELHIPPKDEALVRELATKIPRPFNPGAFCIVLDHVQWFPGIDRSSAIGRHGKPSGFGASDLHTNHIELCKDFQMGKKHNQVSANMELTNSREALRDVSPLLEKLTSAFGNYRAGRMDIVFSPEELQQNKVADEALAPILAAILADLQPEKAVPKHAPPLYAFSKIAVHGQEKDWVIALPAENVSPKKAILKALKGTGYQYHYEPGGFYSCSKKNQYNHVFEVGFGLAPMSHHLTNWFSISGYNFSFNVPTSDTDIADQSVAEEAVQKIMAIALQVEERLTDPLARLYGKTPDWYEGQW